MPLPETNSEIWHHKVGGGVSSLFGLPFFLVGIGVIVLTFIPADVRGGDELPLYFGIPFGGIFACVGGAILFGRMTLQIDRSSGTIVKQWTILSKTIYTKERELSEFDQVSLRSEIRRSKNSSYTVYPVRLMGDGVANFDLSQNRVENAARAEAEELSKFLSLPIHDESSGALRIRQPDSLDQTIKEKFEKGLESNEIPNPPPVLKSRIDYDGSNLKVEIPPPGINAGFIVAVLAIGIFELVFLIGFGIPFFSDFELGTVGIIFVAVFALLFLGVPSLFLLKLIGNAFIAKQSVSVNSSSLTVTKGWPRRKTAAIPSSELEEFYIGVKSSHSRMRKAPVSIGSVQEILAVSDKTQLSFGNGLPKVELDYIHALAKGILVS